MLNDTAADYIAGTLLNYLGGFLFIVVASLAAIWYGAQWYERKARAKRAVKAWRKTPHAQRLAEAYQGTPIPRLTSTPPEEENPFGIRASCSRLYRFRCWLRGSCACRDQPEPEEVDIRIIRKTTAVGPTETRELKAGEVEADIGLVPPPVKWDQPGADLLQDISDAMDATPPTPEQELALLAGAIGQMAAETGLYLPNVALTGPHLIKACEDTTEQLNRLSIGYEKLRRAILQDTSHRRLRVMAEELLP